MASLTGSRAWRVTLAAVTVCATIVMVPGASNAEVTAVSGSAYAYFADVTVPINGHQVRGPAPTVTLPPGGTQSVASTSVVAGPATLFTSGPATVKSEQVTGQAWRVESSVDIQTVNTSGQEVFTASRWQSLCRAGESGTSGSTTITNGTLRIDSGLAMNDDDDWTDPGEHAPVEVAVPSSPGPNTVLTGHIHIGDVVDNFRYVFNEQTVHADGSRTVNAGHLYMLGPAATGDLIIGQSVCGVSTAPLTAQFTSPTQGQTNVTNGTPFNWTAAPGAEYFWLYVGRTQGAADVYSSPGLLPGTQTSETPTLVPNSTLWARIHTYRNGAWTHSDISFTTAP